MDSETVKLWGSCKMSLFKKKKKVEYPFKDFSILLPNLKVFCVPQSIKQNLKKNNKHTAIGQTNK